VSEAGSGFRLIEEGVAVPDTPLRVLATIDREFAAWAFVGTVASFLAFGLISAIIPNPVFGRQIPPEPFALAVWVASAPLMGLVGATYAAPVRWRTDAWRPGPSVRHLDGPSAPSADIAVPLAPAPVSRAGEPQGTTLGAVASVGAFLAIGCPVCNKIALVLLGTSGALTVFAPLQPFIGAASLVLLVGTLAWRLRLRVRGGACALPPQLADA
jgi:hypothetical protein